MSVLKISEAQWRRNICLTQSHMGHLYQFVAIVGNLAHLFLRYIHPLNLDWKCYIRFYPAQRFEVSQSEFSGHFLIWLMTMEWFFDNSLRNVLLTIINGLFVY